MNHSPRLDPAVRRRFEAVVEFRLPTEEKLQAVFRGVLGLDGTSAWPRVFGTAWAGSSFADAVRVAIGAKRSALTDAGPDTVRNHGSRPRSGESRRA